MKYIKTYEKTVRVDYDDHDLQMLKDATKYNL